MKAVNSSDVMGDATAPISLSFCLFSGISEDAFHFRRQFVHDHLRRPCRRKQAVPRRRLRSLKVLVHGRNIGRGRAALERRHRERADIAARACGQASVMLSNARSTWPAVTFCITSPGRTIRTCHRRSGPDLDQFGREWIGSDTGRRLGQLVRIGLDIGREFGRGPAGIFGLTTSMFGSRAIRLTGWKSFAGSNCMLEYMELVDGMQWTQCQGSSVYPSLGAFATAAAPILPPARLYSRQ